MKSEYKKLERVFKGVSNHRRIEILYLVKKYPKINLNGIAESIICNYKTTCVHTQMLVRAGLVNKKYQGKDIGHTLSPYGEKVYQILTTFLDS